MTLEDRSNTMYLSNFTHTSLRDNFIRVCAERKISPRQMVKNLQDIVLTLHVELPMSFLFPSHPCSVPGIGCGRGGDNAGDGVFLLPSIPLLGLGLKLKENFKSEHVRRWRLLLGEFNYEFIYTSSCNFIAPC